MQVPCERKEGKRQERGGKEREGRGRGEEDRSSVRDTAAGRSAARPRQGR